jgi:hypothetical protein
MRNPCRKGGKTTLVVDPDHRHGTAASGSHLGHLNVQCPHCAHWPWSWRQGSCQDPPEHRSQMSWGAAPVGTRQCRPAVTRASLGQWQLVFRKEAKKRPWECHRPQERQEGTGDCHWASLCQAWGSGQLPPEGATRYPNHMGPNT